MLVMALHLNTDCEDSMCKRCKTNLDSHTPARCPKKRPPSRQQKSNPPYTNNNTRNPSNGHNDPQLQLSICTIKLNHIAELIEATRKMTRYFKKSYKHNKSHHTSTNSHHPSTNHNSSMHSSKYKCKSPNTKNQVSKIFGQTHASKTTKSEPADIKNPHDSDSPDSNLDSSSDSE